MAPTKLYLIIISVFTLVIGYDIYNWIRYRTFTKPEIKLQRFRSTVNLIVFMAALSTTLISIAFHINIFNYSWPIAHDKSKSITLKDFKGYKLPSQTMDGVKEFAFITTSIDWDKKGKVLEIKSQFHPSRSYVFNENIVDNFLLQHELYHFHITEYFTRKIRSELGEFENIPSTKIIETTISTHKTLEEAMQRDYDHETYHGYILKQQKRWQLKVDSLLISHQKFTNTKLSFK